MNKPPITQIPQMIAAKEFGVEGYKSSSGTKL
jgi:hypothetical protein